MAAADDITIKVVHGRAGAQRAQPVRTDVFIHEQGIPAELEWDNADAQAWHALACTPQGEIVGTARLLPSGQIGRMAVQRHWRGQGIGGALLHTLIAQAKNAGIAAVFLHAQRSAVSFYLRYGFQPLGAPFSEAGIEHQQMVRGPDLERSGKLC